MKTKKKNRHPRRNTIATTPTWAGRLALVKAGTQFHMAIDGVRLESVRTPGRAKEMFEQAAAVLRSHKKARTA